jgi:hypothetical protein
VFPGEWAGGGWVAGKRKPAGLAVQTGGFRNFQRLAGVGRR